MRQKPIKGILALAAMATASGGNFGGGTGSESNPYLIEDFADLQQVAITTDASKPYSTSASYRLANDIDASSASSKSIGYGVGTFTGKFHGGGHKITKLTITIAGDYVGLISTTSSTTVIDSLILDNPRVIGYSAVGALVGSNNGGIIRDITILKGFVGSNNYGANLGGVVGINYGVMQRISASDTVSDIGTTTRTAVGGIVGAQRIGGSIQDVQFSGYVEGYNTVGGILGYAATGSGSIVSATNSGKVNSSNCDAGGILGASQSGVAITIDSATNKGAVHSGVCTAGGIVGFVNGGGTIRNSVNTGNISAQYYSGGIVGSNGASDLSSVGVKLVRVANKGNITATSTTNGLSFAGGIAGFSNKATIDSSFNTGLVSGPVSIGGIVGHGSYGGMIRHVYNSGMVTASSNYGGGLVGSWIGMSSSAGERDSIVDSYNSGMVTGTASALGGLVGHGNWGGTSYMAMRNCYSMGVVANTSNSGGLIGGVNNTSNNIIITSAYWDKQTSGWSTSAQGTAVGTITAETTQQMFKGVATTYDGWDSTATWLFSSDSSIYPGLRFTNNAPFAFGDTIETEKQDFSPQLFLKNDLDIESGSSNLVVRVLSVSGGTVSQDSSSTISFPNTANNRDSIIAIYRVGETRTSGDTLWGGEAKATIYFITPWRNTYYALYSGSNLAKDSLPVVDSLITGKIPAITTTYGLDSTTGVSWADPGKEKLSSKGFAYVDSFAYVNTKAISHIVASIKPTQFYGGDTINTLLTEGFFQNSGYYPNIRVSYRSGRLYLELMALQTSNGAVNGISAYYDSTSRAVNGASLFSGEWIPVHLLVKRSSASASTGIVELYLGNSQDTAKSSFLTLTFNSTYFSRTANYARRVVQVPQPGTNINRNGTDLDVALGSYNPSFTHKGWGSALVGDFAMISSESMTRKDLVRSYLAGWKHAGSGTADSANYVARLSSPLITQILYAAPGDNSTTSYTSNTSKTATIQFSYGTNTTIDAFAGVEIEPEVLTAECGGEFHIGTHFSMAMESTNAYTTTTSSYSGVETNSTAGDLVVSHVVKTIHHLYERPRMRYLFTPNPSDAQKIYFMAAAPETSSTVDQIQSVREFLAKYAGNLYVLRNFTNLYAKDTATGLVRKGLIDSGLVTKREEFVLEGNISHSFGDQVTSELSASQSFDMEMGMFIDAKLIAGGAVVGGSFSFNATRGQESSIAGTNSFQTDVTFNDDDSWDQHDVIVYNDLRWGVPIYEMQKDLSFTSGPQEPLSQATAIVGLDIQEPSGNACEGDTVEITLKVSNNSSIYNESSLIDSMQIEVEPTENFNGVYQKLVIQPAQFMLSRGDTQSVKVRYKALDTTSIPVSFYINDGFLQNGNFVYPENSTITGSRKVVSCPDTGSTFVRIPHAVASGLRIHGMKGAIQMEHMDGSEIVLDLQGRILFQAQPGETRASIFLQPGVYLVRASSGSFRATVR